MSAVNKVLIGGTGTLPAGTSSPQLLLMIFGSNRWMADVISGLHGLQLATTNGCEARKNASSQKGLSVISAHSYKCMYRGQFPLIPEFDILRLTVMMSSCSLLAAPNLSRSTSRS
ncbi:hypothetical protein ATANTOWER_001077 [Ataeniobius toweri]|uniref:Uncharacterized protein n=1 Tax=Ataeniobius toweri TaxID=208326 RepID=A0ABU7BWY9_9TELE|nr:hypothetical protein [Ataeniobius toweri]